MTVYEGQCKGKVLTAAEKDQMRQDRAARIKASLQGVAPPVEAGRQMTGSGTGFFVDASGLLITNYHVIRSCLEITIDSATGTTVPAKLRGAEEGLDLALLETGMAAPQVATLRELQTLDGHPAGVHGYPNRGMVPLKPLFVEARLTGQFDRTRQTFTFQADVRPGNSGGPLFDQDGAVIGVIFQKIDTVTTYQQTGEVIRDVGRAISIPVLRQMLGLHGVAPPQAAPGPALAPAALATATRPVLARVNCWR